MCVIEVCFADIDGTFLVIVMATYTLFLERSSANKINKRLYMQHEVENFKTIIIHLFKSKSIFQEPP